MEQVGKTKQTNGTNKVIVQIDSLLDKYADKVLFPDKVKEATEMLKKVGLPKISEQKHSKVETKNN